MPTTKWKMKLSIMNPSYWRKQMAICLIDGHIQIYWMAKFLNILVTLSVLLLFPCDSFLFNFFCQFQIFLFVIWGIWIWHITNISTLTLIKLKSIRGAWHVESKIWLLHYIKLLSFKITTLLYSIFMNDSIWIYSGYSACSFNIKNYFKPWQRHIKSCFYIM